MGGRSLLRSVTLTAAFCAALAGCTGEDGMDVVVDGDQDPGAQVAAAIDRTSAATGRMVMAMEWRPEPFGDGDAAIGDESATEDAAWPERVTVRVEAEFDGADLRGTARWVVEGEGGAPMEDSSFDVLAVEGSMYASSGSAAGTFGGLDSTAAVEAALGGRRWIAQGAVEVEDAEFGFFGEGVAGPDSTLDVLGTLSGVEEGPVVQRDGVELRSFTGRVADPSGADDGASWGDEQTSEASRARMERIERYRDEHTVAAAEVLVDPDGLLRRVELTYRDDVEDAYADCGLLFGMGEATMTLEFADLGAPVEITAPDPSDVMSEEEYQAVLDGLEPFDGEDLAVEPMGPAERTEIEQEVRDGASLIGLDPSGIPAMSEDDLYDALDRIYDAEETAPKVATALGEMSRPELLWHVRKGMEREGVDPSLADGLTDQQLADLINTYMADPALAAKVPDGYQVDDMLGADGLPSAEQLDALMFEGCPE